jgi:parallel beta-helix repeat protein/predicted outer membrane repeat protein
VYKVKFLSPIVLILFVVCTVSAGDVIYVDASGPNAPGTGSYEDPFRRIQDAIDSGRSGDTIIVAEGVYTDDANNRNLNFGGKSITIRSSEPNNQNIVESTIIDANGNSRGFYFDSGEDANCIVAGLTIKNGYPVTGAYGGGVYCYNSNPTIRSCIVVNGYAGSGGGFYCDSSNLRIVNCIITGNSAVNYGGGISCNDKSNPEIIGCTISGNIAGEEGGGLDCVRSNPTLFNCIVSNNEASHGGGISCYSPGETRLVNCTLTGNSASNFGGGLYCQYECRANVKNSTLY